MGRFPQLFVSRSPGLICCICRRSFALESSRTVLADPRLPQWRDTSADKPTLSAAEETLLKTIRASGSLAAAGKMAADLPTASRLCVLGAVALLNAIAGRVTDFRQLWPCPWNNRASGGSRRVIRLARNLMRDYPLTDSRSSHGSEAGITRSLRSLPADRDAVREGQQDPELLSRWLKSWQQGRHQTLAKRPHCRGSSLCRQSGAEVPQWQPLFTLHCRRPQPPGKQNSFLQPALGRSGYSATARLRVLPRSSNLLYEPEPAAL